MYDSISYCPCFLTLPAGKTTNLWPVDSIKLPRHKYDNKCDIKCDKMQDNLRGQTCLTRERTVWRIWRNYVFYITIVPQIGPIKVFKARNMYYSHYSPIIGPYYTIWSFIREWKDLVWEGSQHSWKQKAYLGSGILMEVISGVFLGVKFGQRGGKLQQVSLKNV